MSRKRKGFAGWYRTASGSERDKDSTLIERWYRVSVIAQVAPLSRSLPLPVLKRSVLTWSFANLSTKPEASTTCRGKEKGFAGWYRTASGSERDKDSTFGDRRL